MSYSDKDIKELVSVIEQISTFTRVDQSSNESPYESALKYLLDKGIHETTDVLQESINTLNNHETLITYFEVVAGASSGNQVTVPTNGTIVLDKFGASKDAILSTVDGNGNPTWESPRDAGGNIITTSMALDGTYVFSGTPVDANVTIVYVFKIKVVDWGNVDLNFVISENELAVESNLFAEVWAVNTLIGC